MSKYLRFETKYVEGRKTPICTVWSKSGDYILGEIKWHAGWRQFCFYPKDTTIWSDDCLDAIQTAIYDVDTEYRERQAQVPVKVSAEEMASLESWSKPKTDIPFQRLTRGTL